MNALVLIAFIVANFVLAFLLSKFSIRIFGRRSSAIEFFISFLAIILVPHFGFLSVVRQAFEAGFWIENLEKSWISMPWAAIIFVSSVHIFVGSIFDWRKK